MHKPINFSPFATNVLDCIGRKDLQTPDGRPVRIRQDMHGRFIIDRLEYGWVDFDDNVNASAYLNQLEVGVEVAEPADEKEARLKRELGYD